MDFRQQELHQHLQDQQWSKAADDVVLGGQIHPADPQVRLALWQAGATRVANDPITPPRIVGWDWLIDQGAVLPLGEFGLTLLSGILEKNSLIQADWLVRKGLVLPTDAAAMPLVHAAINRAQPKALGWLHDHGVPLDPHHASLAPSLVQAVLTRRRLSLPHVAFLLDKGVRPRPWINSSNLEHEKGDTALLVLARWQAEERLGLPNDVTINLEFENLWDSLVGAGEDPLRSGPDGKTAMDYMKQTPSIGHHLAKQRALKTSGWSPSNRGRVRARP